MPRIKAIHVGLGRWGFSWAQQVLLSHPEVEVVAYVDAVEAARTAAQQRLGLDPKLLFATLSEAMAATEAEMVIAVVPVGLHAPLAEEALRAGKHVLVEKPFTETLEQARGLVDLAKTLGRVLAVSQNYRYYPAPQMAHQIIADGILGELRGIKVDFRRNAHFEGYAYPGIDHPLLVDMAVHHYDLQRMMLGQTATEISARTWNPPGSPFRMDPSGAITFTYSGGVTAQYRGSWLDPGPQTPWAGVWQMDFQRGYVVWQSRGEMPDPQARDELTIYRNNTPPLAVKLERLALIDRAGVLADFARAVRGEKTMPFFPTAEKNIGTVATIHATVESAAKGGAPVALEGAIGTTETGA